MTKLKSVFQLKERTVSVVNFQQKSRCRTVPGSRTQMVHRMMDIRGLNSSQLPDSLVKHVLGTCNNMHAYRRNEQFCDITIKVGETSFKAHKLVLASSCEYFRAMFNTSGFQESRDAEVSIAGNPDAFKILLQFLYSGALDCAVNPETTTDMITDVLKMAHYLQLAPVVSDCETLLVEKFSHCSMTDVLNLLSQSDMYELERLKNRCMKYLAQNFDGSDDFLLLMTHELILETMEHPSSDVVEEKKAFDVIVAWLKHDWDARKQFAARLFQKLRLGVVPPGHVTVTFLQTPELNSIPECQQMVVRVMELRDRKRPSDPPLTESYPDLFETRSTVTAILDLCHRHGDDLMPEYFDTKEDKTWKPLPSMPQVLDLRTFDVSSCVSANDQLYVARARITPGTPVPRTFSTDLLVLDEVKKTWKSLALMTQGRGRCCLVPHYDNHIYAFGGVQNSDDESKKKCEVYVINENRWREIAPMPHVLPKVNSNSAVAYEGKIMVFGEVEVGQNTRSVFMIYDPTRDRWSFRLMSPARPSYIHKIRVLPGTILQNGKCYRVRPIPKMKSGAISEHLGFKVFELGIDVENVRLKKKGDEQNQAVIPAHLRKHMICVDHILYAELGGSFHKLDLSVESIKNKPDDWLMGFSGACVTTYKFDKALYLQRAVQFLP